MYVVENLLNGKILKSCETYADAKRYEEIYKALGYETYVSYDEGWGRR